MVTRSIQIDGMTCGHCINWISQTLMAIDGVSEAKVSLETQSATVSYDEAKVTESMMSGAIEKAGYSVKSFSEL